MFANFRLTRKPLAGAIAPARAIAPSRPLSGPLARATGVLSALWLAACAPTTGAAPKIDTTRAVPVALLLPGGTGNANDELLARSLRQGAQLAMSDLQGVKIDLRVYDNAASPEAAAAAASRAVDEGAKIILGPVHAAAANAAGNAVAGRGVNVLSFSNNADIAGGNVFVLGPTFQNTANRLVSYAARQGRGRIMIVSEQNISGEAGRAAIQQAISRSGATLAAASSFEFSQNGVSAAVPGIVAAAKANNAQAMVLTADAAGALSPLARQLPAAGLDPNTIKLIGLARWDIPSSTLALPGLQGGWFALPDPSLYNQFQSRYQAAYGEMPHPIAGLAYDGIAAIGALVKAGKSDALSASALTQSSGFIGTGGIFRLLPNGTNERGLAVAEIRNNQVSIIDPAPRSFRGAGY